MTEQALKLAERIIAYCDGELAVCGDATEGPWMARADTDHWDDNDNEESAGYIHGVARKSEIGDDWIATIGQTYDATDADADFIADARNHRPGELAAIRGDVELIIELLDKQLSEAVSRWVIELTVKRLTAIAAELGVQDE